MVPRCKDPCLRLKSCCLAFTFLPRLNISLDGHHLHVSNLTPFQLHCYAEYVRYRTVRYRSGPQWPRPNQEPSLWYLSGDFVSQFQLHRYPFCDLAVVPLNAASQCRLVTAQPIFLANGPFVNPPSPSKNLASLYRSREKGEEASCVVRRCKSR